MFFAKKVLLGKIEGAYGTDPTPDVANNAFEVQNLEVTDLELVLAKREVVRPFYSNEGEVVAGYSSVVNFAVPLAGAGAAGTAPKWAPALRACGFSETVNGGISVVYALVSGGEASMTFYFQVDGRQHKIQGWRGSLEMKFTKDGIPLMQLNGRGLHVQPTDTALGVPVFTGWQKPLAFNKANTTTLTLHGIAVACSELSYNQANEILYRNLPNSESVRITGRMPTGSVTFEDNLVATKDWWAVVKAATTGALAVVHGVATNQVKVDAPAVQLTAPKTGNDGGILNRTFNLNFKPSAGNDELVITVL